MTPDSMAAALGIFLMLGPWADPVDDLNQPVISFLAGNDTYVLNATICGGLGDISQGHALIQNFNIDLSCKPIFALSVHLNGNIKLKNGSIKVEAKP